MDDVFLIHFMERRSQHREIWGVFTAFDPTETSIFALQKSISSILL